MLGQRIKERRVELGLSQEELSEHCGISQSELSKLERGRYGRIETGRLKRLAIALHISADWLLELEPVG